MNAWFPANPTVSFRSSTVQPDELEKRPRVRLLCFPGSGFDASIFTTPESTRKPLPNPLLSYCLDNDIQLLAVHLPGRTTRIKEPLMSNAFDIAETVLDLIEPLLVPQRKSSENITQLLPEIPLVVVAHSMGTFIAYEFLCLMRHRGLPPAKHFVISCMLSPDTPKHLRGWRDYAELTSEGLKDEGRSWGTCEEAFLPHIWKVYERILTSDFLIGSTYEFSEPDKRRLNKSAQSTRSTTPATSPNVHQTVASFHAPLGISTTACYADQDQHINEQHMIAWKKLMLLPGVFAKPPPVLGVQCNPDAEFRVEKIPGGHNMLCDPIARVKWMEIVTQVLDKILIELEYGC